MGRRCQELHSINATNKMKIDRLEEMEESFREITRLAGSAMRATTKAGEALPDDKVMVPKRDGWAEAQPPVLAATETQGPVIPVTDPGAETGRASLPIKHGGQEDETWTPEDYSRMLLRAEGSGDGGGAISHSECGRVFYRPSTRTGNQSSMEQHRRTHDMSAACLTRDRVPSKGADKRTDASSMRHHRKVHVASPLCGDLRFPTSCKAEQYTESGSCIRRKGEGPLRLRPKPGGLAPQAGPEASTRTQ